ncbi:MAG: alpha amylase N-terminal ig-like domain-containing protein, partial [Bacillota bacterium]
MTQQQRITFSYKPVIPVESVHLVGEFNNWDPQATPMFDNNGDGTYKADLELEPGEYQYKFLINSKTWQKPPEADYYVTDGFGGENGVKIVEVDEIMKEAARGDGIIHFGAIYHHPEDIKYVDQLAKERLTIRLQTRMNDVEEVIIYYNDSKKGSSELELVASYDYLDFYEVTLEIEGTELEYYFKVCDSDKVIWYDQSGICECTEEGDYELTPFKYNLAEHEVFKTPDWVRDAVFYQIFPDRFYNANPDNDPEKIEIYRTPTERYDALIPEWDQGVPSSSPILTEETKLLSDSNEIHPEAGHYVFYGGDLQGIKEKIPYLKRLGINAIYLNPVFKATANHRYNTVGYELVDESLAIPDDQESSQEYLINLIEELHQQGIKVIFDAVFNHTGYEHWAFQDIVEQGADSKYVDWYQIHDFPIIPLSEQHDDNPPNYECWWGFGHLPKLNAENPEVQDY